MLASPPEGRHLALMTALPEPILTVADYLAFEESASERHEYIGGRIHAMDGTSERHNLIALNVATFLHGKLRGGPCRAYMSGFKVRVEINRNDLFYYPDIMVSCLREGVDTHYLRYPKLIAEILSPSTEAIDRREKFLNYRTIPTLDEYVVISQDTPGITLHRRRQGWQPVVLRAPEDPVELESLRLTLPLAQVYEGL
jgi:Uma2 family endonuclease